MDKALRWSINGVDEDAQGRARQAARRAGVSLAEWLNGVIDGADGLDRTSNEPAQERPQNHAETAAFRPVRWPQASAREPSRRGESDHGSHPLDAIAAQLGRLNRSTPSRPAGGLDRDRDDEDRPQSRREIPARRAAARPAPAERAKGVDLARIEAKLNNLLDRVSTPAAAPARAASASRAAQTPSRPAQMPARPAQMPARPAQTPSRSSNVDFQPIKIAAEHIDQRRRELDRYGKSAERAHPDAARFPSTPSRDAAASDVKALRAQIEGLSQGLSGLAQRDSLAALDTAIRDLGDRVSASRDQGARESVLQPIESLAQELRLSLADVAPRDSVERIAREVGALSGKLEAQSPADQQTLREISAQTAEMRRLMLEAAAQPAPLAQIERQLRALGERLDQLPSEPAASVGSDLEAGIADIRAAIERAPQPGLFKRLETQVEDLSRLVGAAIADPRAERATQDISDRLDALQRAMAGRAAEDRSANTSSEMLRDIHVQTAEMSRRLSDTAAHPSALAQIDHRIGALSDRLDQMSDDRSSSRDALALDQSLAAMREALERAPPANALNRLEARVEQLADVVGDALTQTPAAGQFDDLSRRLDDVQRALSSRFEEPAAIVDTSALERMMRDMAIRLDQPAAAAAGELRRLEDLVRAVADKVDGASQLTAVDDLRHELSRLSERVDGADSSQALGSLQSSLARLAEKLDERDDTARLLSTLERSVGELFGQIETSRRATVEAAEAAARDHVRSALAQRSADEPAMSRELADLRTNQDAADKRTHATLIAVHDALEKVVDRLTTIEDDLAEVAPEPLVAAPSRRAVMVAAPRAPASERAEASDPIDADLSDQLLEPGSGFPRGEPRPSMTEAVAERATQADFIAAARRAAQKPSEPKTDEASVGGAALSSARERAKAAHLAMLSAASSQRAPRAAKRAGRLGQAVTAVGSRKRAILMALAGLVAVLGSLQALRVANTPPPRAEVVGAAAPAPSPPNLNATPPAVKSEAVAPAQNGAWLSPDPARGAGADKFQKFTTSATDATPVGAIPTPSSPIDAAQAANAGDKAAQIELGQRYADGRNGPRDPKLAIQWFEKAANQGDAVALYRLGAIYERGVGVERDLKRARDYYSRAADVGNTRAMHNLAVLSAEGVDGKPDYTSAVSWFRKAGEYGVKDSQYNLAILYARGLGADQNLVQAWALFSIVADQGDADAAKKRDEVGLKFDANQLASAKALAATYRPRVALKAANEPFTPAGGWLAASAPAPAAAAAPAAAKPATKASARVSSL